MFDINKTIMRCLTKNLAMFGLGLYIYAGEDLPEDETPPKYAGAHNIAPGKAKKNVDPNKKINAKSVEALEGLIAKTNSDRNAMLGFYGIDKLEDMTNVMAKDCYDKLKGKLNGK